jgi:pimeloyl-ACP methyl ester carboxylesterase
MLAALKDGRYEDALVAFVRDMVKLAPDEIDAYRASPAWGIGVDLIWTMRREGLALSGLDADITQYSRIDRPIQLLVGPRTARHRSQAVSALAGVLPNAETTVLQGQGHGALMQAPDLVARAITDFLLRVG